MMKMHKIILIGLLLICLCSCTIFKVSDSEFIENLDSQSKMFDTFKMNGIIEYNYKQFSFRKNISLRKKDDSFRLDVFDSGLLGMSPSPFLSVYADTFFVYRMSSDEVVLNAEDKKNVELVVTTLRTIGTAIRNHKAELLKDRQVKINDISISMSRYGLIDVISVPLQCSKVKFMYSDSGLLSELIVNQGNKDVINIKIDKISTTKVKVLPIKN